MDMSQAPAPPRKGDIHCPFCAWNRVEVRLKGWPEFDRDGAIKRLAEHITETHWGDFSALVREVNIANDY